MVKRDFYKKHVVVVAIVVVACILLAIQITIGNALRVNAAESGLQAVAADSSIKSLNGWESGLEMPILNADGTTTYDFGSNKAQGGWSTKKIASQVPFKVGKPFVIRTKMHWVYNSAGYPTPSCYTFAFKNTMNDALTKMHNFQIFNQWFGMYEIGGVPQNQFIDLNQAEAPVFNKFEIVVNETNTSIVINDSEKKSFNTIKAGMFPDGNIYMAIGMLFDAAVDVSEYKFSVAPIDALEISSSKMQTIVKGSNSTASFSIDSRGVDEQGIVVSEDNSVIDKESYKVEDGILIFDGAFCDKLSVGTHTINISNGKGSGIDVEIVVMHAPVNTLGWSISVTKDSSFHSANCEFGVDNAKSFIAKSKTKVNVENGIILPFSVPMAGETSAGDELQFNFKTDSENLTIVIDLKESLATISGVYDEFGTATTFAHLDNYLYFRAQEVNNLKIVRANGILEVFINEFRSVPLKNVSDVTLTAAEINIEAKYQQENSFMLQRLVSEFDFIEESVNGWSSLHGDKISVNPDGTTSVELNDASFDSIIMGDKAYGRDRIYSTKGYDVSKPIILYMYSDWEASLSGWWGMNLSSSKYEFNQTMKNTYKYDFLFGSAHSGERLEYVPTGAKLLFSDRNNPMVTYTDRTQMNKIKIEVGELGTKITINDISSATFPISRSEFTEDKVYINFGGFLNLDTKIVRFTFDAINAIDVGVAINQNFTLGSDIGVQYDVRDVPVVKVKVNNNTLTSSQFEFSSADGLIKIPATTLNAIFANEKQARYEISISSENMADSTVYLNLLVPPESLQDDFDKADKEIERDKSGCGGGSNSASDFASVLMICGAMAFLMKIKKLP